MPAPGDQHKPVPNPFGDMQQQQQQQRQSGVGGQCISEYTAQEIATLQSRLQKQLGPEYLSARSGPSGQKVHYIAAEKVISLANEVFGFNGWSSSIQNIQIDFVDEQPHTFKISVGLSVIVRVTLRDGTYHEDIGYGHIENCKGKAAAFEKAKKEGTTDALKRTLRNFGNVLGNCIYDKAYVERVSKMKAVPVNKRPFSEENLHRHANYTTSVVDGAIKTEQAASVAAVSRPSARPAAAAAPQETVVSVKPDTSFSMDMFDEDLLGDFDEADFCVPDEGHPDEVVVYETSVPALPPPHQNQNSRNASPVRQMDPRPVGNGMQPRPPHTPTTMNQARPNGGAGFGQRPYQQGASNQQASRPLQQNAAQRQPGVAPYGQKPGPSSTTNGNNGNKTGAGEVEGTPWLSARAVAKVGDGDALGVVATSIQAGHLFNPKAESPSIRKTPDVDHTTSKPVSRQNRPAANGPVSVSGGGAAAGGATQASVATPGAGGPGATGVTTRSGFSMNSHSAMAEPVRRIGAPPSAASPLANRGHFRPPPMKRGPPTDSVTARPPLADVSTSVSANGGGGTAVATSTAADSGGDAKRQKVA